MPSANKQIKIITNLRAIFISIRPQHYVHYTRPLALMIHSWINHGYRPLFISLCQRASAEADIMRKLFLTYDGRQRGAHNSRSDTKTQLSAFLSHPPVTKVIDSHGDHRSSPPPSVLPNNSSLRQHSLWGCYILSCVLHLRAWLWLVLTQAAIFTPVPWPLIGWRVSYARGRRNGGSIFALKGP